jgi:hypothetical protein
VNEIEKAIKALEIAKENPAGKIRGVPYYAIIEPAVDIALAALREQAERMKGCNCCNDGAIKLTDLHAVAIKGDTLYVNCADHKYDYSIKISFCPVCGKRLEVKQDG